jgi:hypothetical protein
MVLVSVKPAEEGDKDNKDDKDTKAKDPAVQPNTPGL